MSKYEPNPVVCRKSSPRLLAYDPGLVSAVAERSDHAVLADRELRGHVVESAVGAYLLARSKEAGFRVQWWRDGGHEVDFVLSSARHLVAVEVKSGRTKSQSGMAEFLRRNPQARRVVVGGSAAGACGLEDFLLGKVALPWD